MFGNKPHKIQKNITIDESIFKNVKLLCALHGCKVSPLIESLLLSWSYQINQQDKRLFGTNDSAEIQDLLKSFYQKAEVVSTA